MGDGAATRVTDQGYAWVILVATFFAQAGSIGFSIGGIGLSILSFGNAFPAAQGGSLGMLGSLRISIQFLSSLLVLPLAEKLGFRLVAASGCVLAAAAIVATIAATELWHAYILYGIIAGFGICCPYATTMALLGQYFDRLKHIAFPVVALGQAVGTLSFPPIVEAVREAYGHAGMLTFMSGSMIISFVCSLLLKPNDGRSLVQSYTCSSKTSAGHGAKPAAGVAARAEPAAAARASPDSLPLTKKALEVEQQKLVVNGDEDGNTSAVKPGVAEDSDSTGRCSALGALLNLLRRWQVCLLITNSLLWGCCTSGTQALLPMLANQHCVKDEMSALGMTTNGIGMLLASIVMTSLGKCTYDRHLLYMLSCGLYGVPPLLLPLVGVTAPTYVALFSVSGWWLATLLALSNSVLFDMASSPAEFAKLLSLYFFANGVGCFIGPVTIGSISDSFAPHVRPNCFPANATTTGFAANATTTGFAAIVTMADFAFNVTTPSFADDNYTTPGFAFNFTTPGFASNITTTGSYAMVWPAPEWPAWTVCGLFGIASTLVFIPTYISNRRKRAAKDLHGKHGSAEAANTKLVSADEAS